MKTKATLTAATMLVVVFIVGSREIRSQNQPTAKPQSDKETPQPATAPDDLVAQGHKLREAGQLEQALRMYQRAADAGDKFAHAWVAMAYRYGDGVPQNYAVAASQYERAAENGDRNACYSLGQLYEYGGPNLTANLEQARHWFTKAGQLGDERAAAALKLLGQPKSPLELGLRLRDDKRFVESLKELLKAATEGDREASGWLGMVYHHGEGTERDFGQAADWYRKAVDAGDKPSCYALGELYSEGDKHLPQDLNEAQRWFTKAGEMGHKRAARALRFVKLQIARKQAAKSAPKSASPPPAIPKPPTTRTVKYAEGTVTISTWPDGRIELHDEGGLARYATDSPWPDKRLKNLAGGDLAFSTDQNTEVTIHPNGERTVAMPKLRLSLREATEPWNHVREFTFSEPVKLLGRSLQGRWVRERPDSQTWRRNDTGNAVAAGKEPIFKGDVLMYVDFMQARAVVQDAAGHIAADLDARGFGGFEFQDDTNQRTLFTVKNSPDGRRIEETPLDPATQQKLGLAAEKSATSISLFHSTGKLRAKLIVARTSDGKSYVAGIDTPDGRSLRRTSANDTNWTGPQAKEGVIFRGDIQQIGADTIRHVNLGDNQIVIEYGDGSRTTEFLTERTEIDADGRLAKHNSKAYTLKRRPNGTQIVTDWSTGRAYSTARVGEVGRATLEADAVTFVDHFQQTITQRGDGRRTVVSRSGRRAEFDAGGRLVGLYEPNNAVTVAYTYERTKGGEFVIRSFINNYGDEAYGGKKGFFKVIDQPDGKQRLALMTGEKKDVIAQTFENVRVYVDSQNTLVIEDGANQRATTLRGIEIRRVRSQLPDGGSKIEQTVGIKRNSQISYGTTTYLDAAGRETKQELKSSTRHFVRGGQGRDFGTAPWYELDEAGQPKPGSSSPGEIALDENGTLCKALYESEPDPDRPGELRAKMTAAPGGKLTPVVRKREYDFTSGESEQWFADGSVVHRNRDNDVLWRRTPAGAMLGFFYEGSGKDKQLIGFDDGFWLWAYNKKSKTFFGRCVDGRALPHTYFTFSVNPFTADVELINLLQFRQTTRRDGSLLLERSDGQRSETNSAGQVTRYTTINGRSYEVFYKDGLIDMVTTGKTIILRWNGKSALPAETGPVIPATEINLHGSGREMFLSYVTAQGHRVQCWPDGTSEEYDNAAGGTLIRAEQLGRAWVREGHLRPGEKPHSIVCMVVRDLGPWQGMGTDRRIEFTNDTGQRVADFAGGQRELYDEFGRLVDGEYPEVPRLQWVFSYGSPESPASQTLTAVQSLDHEWSRDAKTGAVTRSTVVDADGTPSGPETVRDVTLSPRGFLLTTFSEGDERIVERTELRTGRRTTISRDGVRTEFDRFGRLTYVENAWGDFCALTYAGIEHRVPEKVIDFQGDERHYWQRSAESSQTQPTEVVHWIDEKSKATLDRAAFDKDQRFVLCDWLFRPREFTQSEPAATTELHHSQGKLTGLTRRAKAGDGSDIITRIVRDGSGKWTDARGMVYDAIHVDSQRRTATLTTDDGKRALVVEFDRGECELHYGDDFRRILRREWNARGDLTSLVGTENEGAPFRFYKADNGRLVVLFRYPNGLVLDERLDVWISSLLGNDVPIRASLQLASLGDQTWTGENGTVRVVRENGTMEIERLDRSRTIDRPGREGTEYVDQHTTRHVHAPGHEVQEVLVHGLAGVEVRFDDGTSWRQGPLSDVIARLDRDGSPERDKNGRLLTFRGSLKVADNGDLVYLEQGNQRITIYSSNGVRTYLSRSQGIWISTDDSVDGRSRGEVERHLYAVDQGDSQSAWAVDFREVPVRTPLTLGLEEFLTRGIKSTRDADGTERWSFTPGDKSKSDIVEVVRLPDGRIEARAAGGSRFTSGEWPEVRRRLDQQFPQAGYAELAIASLFDRLKPARGFPNYYNPFVWRGWADGREGPELARVGKRALVRFAEEGDVLAQRELGTYYLEGPEAERDLKLARQWIDRAAAQGDLHAKNLLPVLARHEEKGLEKPKVDPLLVRAAELGDPRAQYDLGMQYARAGELEKARMWLEKSAAVQFPKAKAALAEIEEKLKAAKSATLKAPPGG